MSMNQCKTLDLSKPVQTRDGRKVRILATDIRSYSGANKMAVAITMSDGREEIFTFHMNGRYSQDYENASDLINVPEERIVYMNVYRSFSGQLHVGNSYDSAFDAKEGGKGPVGRVKVVLREGCFDD